MIVPFSTLLGKYLTKYEISPDKDSIIFYFDDDSVYEQYHSQSCCESVSIESIVGDLDDLLNTPILIAEESFSHEDPSDIIKQRFGEDGFTWTFYKLATIKGYVDIRWYGTSNSCYSERASLYLISKPRKKSNRIKTKISRLKMDSEKLKA